MCWRVEYVLDFTYEEYLTRALSITYRSIPRIDTLSQWICGLGGAQIPTPLSEKCCLRILILKTQNILTDYTRSSTNWVDITITIRHDCAFCYTIFSWCVAFRVARFHFLFAPWSAGLFAWWFLPRHTFPNSTITNITCQINQIYQ